MGNIKRTTAFIAVIVFSALILCMLLSFSLNGMRLTPRILSDYVFMCSMVVSLVGAIGIILPFSFLKMKLRRNPTVTKLEPEDKNKGLWKTIFISGLVLLLISYLIVLI